MGAIVELVAQVPRAERVEERRLRDAAAVGLQTSSTAAILAADQLLARARSKRTIAELSSQLTEVA